MLGICLTLIDDPSDRERFVQLHNTYEEYMFNIAMSILNSEALADETVQDCFLKIAEEFDRVGAVRSKETKAMLSILNSEALADETVQDCFLKIAEEFDRVGAVRSKETKAMLSIMVKNKALDNLDKEHYDRTEYIKEDDDFVSDQLIDDLSSQVGYNQLVQEIKKLDDTYRDILSLRFIYEHTAKEISEILRIPLRTVETRIFRGRRILIEKLEGIIND